MTDRDLEQQFLDFHRDNPVVYRLFDRFTRQVIETGREHYSADAILHRVRWHTTIETSGDGFKINNNWAAFYSRMWMRDHPEHDVFFETRVQKALIGGDDDYDPEPPPPTTAEQLGLFE